MSEAINNDEKILIAKKVQDECINAALQAFASASEDGLCCEGAWECAIDAIRNLSPVEIVNRISPPPKLT